MGRRWTARSGVPAVVAGIAIVSVFLTPIAEAGASTTPASGGTFSIPAASGTTTKTIVLLKDTASGLHARSSARASALHAAESPVISAVHTAGAKLDSSGSQLPFVVANLSANQRNSLSGDSNVAGVFPDVTIPNPMAPTASDAVGSTGSTPTSNTVAITPSNCGTADNPEQDPEALSVIKADQATDLGYDGAGVTVAYIAGGIDTTIPDFQRNALYGSAGSPVVSDINFSGDPSSDIGGDASIESFLDASSIASQGNGVYDLNNYISTSHSEPSSPCDIKITGAAPGASVIGLNVFSDDFDTTESNFLQAIDYAINNNVLVLNESFGSNNYPDTALDATRIADDDAVAAGVTVVVSSGDAGVTNTLGSPSTDPNLISAGASTTFRSYEQDFYGGINATTPKANNGTWIDSNLSSLSSGGFSQSGGNTVDLVAPGDLNWIDCSTGTTPVFTGCTNNNGQPSPILLEGGTSESAPLTSAAAADVIQAYAANHGGSDPTPALVKQILMSTATDISAPGEQQGAGLLNVLAAVREAASINGGAATPGAGTLISPNQINLVQQPGTTAQKTITLTNTGSTPETVNLSTRALTNQVANATGALCLNPSSVRITCGVPTTSTINIWSGVTEVYKEKTFTVPAMTSPSRLNFSATYPYTGQSSLLHVALYDPTGAYAGYSLPQGLAEYANIQVANPAPGTWTAVFFTEQNGATAHAVGTSGNINWQATSTEFEPAGTVNPSTLHIAPGATGSARLTVTMPSNPGDTAQSVVVSTVGGPTTTIPVTMRTMIPITISGGTFSGTLTGGNGRGNPAVGDTYVFNVGTGLRDIDVSLSFPYTNDEVVGFLLDPEGETVANSSSVTDDPTGDEITTGSFNLYKDSPEAGRWTLILDWLPPNGNNELSMPFTGAVRFNQVSVSSNLPQGNSLHQGQSYTYNVTVNNTGVAPQAFFLDPRTTSQSTYSLANINGPSLMVLPLPPGTTFPVYDVPTDTSSISATLFGLAPVTFDTEPFLGDPDLSPALPTPGAVGSQGPFDMFYYAASLSYTPPGGEMTPGLWYLNPSEIGPYGTGGADAALAEAEFSVSTLGFDGNVVPSTGDLWEYFNGINNDESFTPVYVMPGTSVTIPLTITPSANVGTLVRGTIKVDDTFLENPLVGPQLSGDELSSLSYSYKVSKPLP